MKHPTTSQWNIAKTSEWYVSTTFYWNVVTTSSEDVTTTSHHYVFTTSQKSLKWNTQWRLSGTSARRLCNKHIHDVPLVRLYNVSCKSQLTGLTETPSNIAVVRLHHVSELRCCDGLYVFKLLCHELNLVGFHVSFKYQIKHQMFLVLIRRETNKSILD